MSVYPMSQGHHAGFLASHVTAHLIGKSGGGFTILALSLDGMPLWDQSILSSPSTVLMDWLGDIP